MILEILLSIVIVIAILLFAGVPLASILNIAAFVLAGLLVLAVVLIAVFFFGTDISLLFFRKATGRFLRFDDEGKFERAVYQVGEKEFTCLFPAESVARRKIYERDSHFLMIPKKEEGRIAYDRHSLVIIAVGTVSSLLSLLGFFLIWLLLLS